METVTAAERAAGRLGAAKLERLAAAFRAEGMLVLHDALPHEALDALRARLDHDAAYQALEPEPLLSTWEDRGGHLQMGVPRCAPYVRREIVANPILEQLAQRLLGGPCHLAFFNGNTNLPGSELQHLHSDGALTGDPRTLDLVFNFGIDVIGEEDGPTELFPATHAEPSMENEAVERRAGSARLNTLPKGSVSGRDYRLWHRGTANRSERPRHMLALSYSARQRPPGTDAQPSDCTQGGRHRFGADCAAAFSRDWWPATAAPSAVDFNVAFSDEQGIDHFGNLPSGPAEMGERGRLWRPELAGPLPLDSTAGFYGDAVPEWVRRCGARGPRL